MPRVLTSALVRLALVCAVILPATPAFTQPVQAATVRPSPTIGQTWRSVPGLPTPPTRSTAPKTKPQIQPRSSTTPQLIADPGFEAGSTGPWAQSSAANRQLIDTYRPHDGSYSAHLCQAVSNCNDSVYQAITVPGRVVSATLSFWFLVGSQDPASSCADTLAVGLADSGLNAAADSGARFCSDWSGQPWTYQTIDETTFLQSHAGQTVNVVAQGTADGDTGGGWSEYNVDDFALTISYATSPLEPYTAMSDRQYRLGGSDGNTWVDMDPSTLALSVTPPVDSSAIISGNVDLWTATAGVNQDVGIAVAGGTLPTYPTTTGQPEAWKESGGNAGTFSPNAAFVQTVVQFKAGTAYTVKLQWKTNHVTGGLILAGAGPIGTNFSPTRLTVKLVPSGGPAVASTFSQTQFRFDGSNGSTWTPLPVSLPAFVAPADGQVIVGANSDLWTANAGVNQDLAISSNGQVAAWKESGGFAGIFSPNAAFVQTVVHVTNGSSYTFGLQWKSNHQTGGSIFAGAGPINGNFSPTTLTMQFIPGGTGLQDAVSTGQYQLAGSDGAGWYDIDSSGLSLSITPPTDCVAVLSGNADLWTVAAGYNQDIGISLSWAGHTLPPYAVGWKESGGFAGTFSPNAAFVQTAVPLAAGVTYTAKLQWKTNKPSPENATIVAGASPTGPWSPTRLTSQLLCPQKLVITTPPQTFAHGTPSGLITIQLQDAWGNSVNATGTGQVINLTSTSSAGVFTPAPAVTILPGSNSATFQYTDATVGTPTITASAPGVTGASQQETIQ